VFGRLLRPAQRIRSSQTLTVAKSDNAVSLSSRTCKKIAVSLQVRRHRTRLFRNLTDYGISRREAPNSSVGSVCRLPVAMATKAQNGWRSRGMLRRALAEWVTEFVVDAKQGMQWHPSGGIFSDAGCLLKINLSLNGVSASVDQNIWDHAGYRIAGNATHSQLPQSMSATRAYHSIHIDIALTIRSATTWRAALSPLQFDDQGLNLKPF
jgi:hypothetical protein